jgi:hypothetical protein
VPSLMGDHGEEERAAGGEGANIFRHGFSV